MTDDERFEAWWKEYLSLNLHYWWDSFSKDSAKASWHAALESRWIPIESAPRDGTEILLFYPGGVIESDWLYPSTHTFATHWQPLPAPPTED